MLAMLGPLCSFAATFKRSTHKNEPDEKECMRLMKGRVPHGTCPPRYRRCRRAQRTNDNAPTPSTNQPTNTAMYGRLKVRGSLR